jgi:hypothetical protein
VTLDFSLLPDGEEVPPSLVMPASTKSLAAQNGRDSQAGESHSDYGGILASFGSGPADHGRTDDPAAPENGITRETVRIRDSWRLEPP